MYKYYTRLLYEWSGEYAHQDAQRLGKYAYLSWRRTAALATQEQHMSNTLATP
jgi:hypothetical protein